MSLRRLSRWREQQRERDKDGAQTYFLKKLQEVSDRLLTA